MKLPSQLACFIKVAEYQSFHLAAKHLHLTTTAVSKHIKNLETTLNEQLFARTTRSVALTEIGETLYHRCRLVEDELLSITHLLEAKKSTPEGTLKILVSNILSKAFILKHLSEFTLRYPQITLEISFTEEGAALSDKTMDVMVGFPQITPYTEHLKYRKMYDTQQILCASKAYIKRHGEPKQPSDLLNAKIISHTLRSDNYELKLANGKRLPCAKPFLMMNNYEALNQACCDGLGLYLTADTMVQTELETKKLVKILPDVQFSTYEIFMFYRPYHFELPKIRAFVEFYMGKLARQD